VHRQHSSFEWDQRRSVPCCGETCVTSVMIAWRGYATCLAFGCVTVDEASALVGRAVRGELVQRAAEESREEVASGAAFVGLPIDGRQGPVRLWRRPAGYVTCDPGRAVPIRVCRCCGSQAAAFAATLGRIRAVGTHRSLNQDEGGDPMSRWEVFDTRTGVPILTVPWEWLARILTRCRGHDYARPGEGWIWYDQRPGNDVWEIGRMGERLEIEAEQW